MLKDKNITPKQHFAPMTLTYMFGVFNDNFFKQSAMLLALGAGLKDAQALITIIFTLPYLFLTSASGWCADRFAKRNVVIASKALEVVAVCFGIAGLLMLEKTDTLYSGSWILIFTMVGIMGAQSSIFSPALNGSIPEIFTESYVMYVNSILKLVVTASIFAGVGFAGIIMDIKVPSFAAGYLNRIPAEKIGQTMVCIVMFLVAVLGFIFSFGVKSKGPSSNGQKFPILGPINALEYLYKMREDALLSIAVWANTFIWFIGSLMVLIINELGKTQLGYSNTSTSLMVVALMFGVSAGALICAKTIKERQWYTVIIPASLAMAFMCLSVFFVPLMPDLYISILPVRLVVLVAVFGAIGIAGGMYLIPVVSFIQIRPKADRKGNILGASNFAGMGGVMLSGPVYWIFVKLSLKPSQSFFVIFLLMMIYSIFIKKFLAGKKTD